MFVAEIGDITRFATPQKLTCWAGMTPSTTSPTPHVRRGRITKQGSRLVRWAAVESCRRLPEHHPARRDPGPVAVRRGHNIGVVAAARRQLEYVYYALRDHHVSADLRTPAPPTAPGARVTALAS